ncbi:hypothetical protein A4G23_04544 [Streptomyces rubrolavendulae]|uniref:Uncharacterized protein n=1 Tax=Streptomyces rubrolavendulae TaxID=285473 RepID=A0A1D8G879_9ACTN|nr:hypothetical protein A4G23_04544 [Streptomyces rubrolavendulae]
MPIRCPGAAPGRVGVGRCGRVRGVADPVREAPAVRGMLAGPGGVRAAPHRVGAGPPGPFAQPCGTGRPLPVAVLGHGGPVGGWKLRPGRPARIYGCGRVRIRNQRGRGGLFTGCALAVRGVGWTAGPPAAPGRRPWRGVRGRVLGWRWVAGSRPRHGRGEAGRGGGAAEAEAEPVEAEPYGHAALGAAWRRGSGAAMRRRSAAAGRPPVRPAGQRGRNAVGHVHLPVYVPHGPSAAPGSEAECPAAVPGTESRVDPGAGPRGRVARPRGPAAGRSAGRCLSRRRPRSPPCRCPCAAPTRRRRTRRPGPAPARRRCSRRRPPGAGPRGPATARCPAPGP